MSIMEWSCLYSTKIYINIFIIILFVFKNNCATTKLKLNNNVQNIIVYNQSLYIGGTNFIQRISYDLKVLATFSTGPKKDSPYCSFSLGCVPGHNENLTNSYNSILLVTMNPQPSLFICSNIYAACKFLSLTTLEDLYKNRNFISIAANIPDAGAVAIISDVGKISPLIVAKTAKVALTVDSRSLSAISAYQLVDDESLLKEFEVDGEPVKIPYNKNLIFQSIGSLLLEAKSFIDYKSIFRLNSFYYILTVQQNLQSLQNVSKIIRFSFTETFGDYIEQPLACQKGGMVFDILISTSFVKLNSKVSNWFNNTEDSFLFGILRSSSNPNGYAVCYWSMNEINDEIEIQRNNCRSQEDISWAPYLDDFNERCTKEVVQLSNLRLAPTKVIQGKLLLDTKGEVIGSLAPLVHERGLSLYVSTEKNPLQRFAVTSTSLHRYSEEKFSDDHIFTRMIIEPSHKYLFMVSDQHIVKTNIDNCESRKSCFDCLSGPYCGWCTLTKRCTEKSKCENAEKQHYFISSNTDACPKLSKVDPSRASISTVSKISFETKNIPSDVEYGCMVNDIQLDVTSNGAGKFTCNQLDFSTIKPFTPVNGFAKIDVSLVITNKEGDKIRIATSNITLYSCQEFKSCKSCITGDFSCGWCSSSLSCHENADSCLDKVTWISYRGKDASFVDFCPTITDTMTQQVSFDATADIILNGKKLVAATETVGYECVFEFDGMSQKTPATYISSSQVKCTDVQLNYKSEVASLTAKVRLIYGGIFIDLQKNSVSVQVYKCHVDRSDCIICLTAPADWNCGWCMNSSRCSIEKSCNIISSWANDKCPVPVIKKFSPTEVAIGGGAKVEIYGSDFGLKAEDILNVTLAGKICKILAEEYIISQRIVCTAPTVLKEVQGKIVITVNSTGGRLLKGISTEDFFYRNPQIVNVQPSVGPCSGGTIITLHGKYLNVGNKVEIKINNQLCLNLQRNSSSISCETKASTCPSNRKRKRRNIAGFVEIFFDNSEVKPTFGIVQFTYVVDPVIGIVYTNKKSIFLTTFKSGGQLFRVEGQRFDTIQNPKMLFKTFDNPPILHKTPCHVHYSSYMTCLSPNMSDMNVKDSGTTVMLGFEMDKVASIRSLRNLTVHPDPIFDSFPGDKIFIVKDDDLVLTGRYFDALSSEDVNVTIGGLSCHVTDLDKRLGCTLPKKEDVLADNDEPVPVKVVVGEGGLTYDIGSIKYFVAMESDSRLIYILIGVAFVLVVLIIIIVLLVWYRRRKKKEKEYEQLVQIKLDKMESQYAREAREAFAAYQTEITDLTKDIEQAVPQYLDFRQYAMRVLYPGMASHPILEANRDESPEWESCMLSFIDLLKKEDFLLTFIRTLESQSSFQMTDRCMVASLLTVSLQDDLKYITEILMILLTDLINRKGSSSKHPKLLLRRTESVAEKLLTNWLAYTLHSFLREHVGEHLFKLFSAITSLIDKEPVDAITCDARNSLSEDKLLRQKIEFNVLTINVEFIYPSEAGTYENIQVLTCDTISQTKEKIIKHIYKSKPYSEWPLPGDLQLGFTSPNGACLQLKDEDPTNIIEGDWKKINTLEHYKVPDNSSMRLEPYSEANLNQSNSFANTGNNQVVTSPRLSKFQSSKRKFNTSSTRSMQDLDQSQKGLIHENSMGSIFQPSHASTPMLHHNHHDSREPKLWHIAKHTDYPQEQKEDSRDVMAEVFLTRLLKTKETLHMFVDSLLKSMFGVDESGVRVIPQAVKYLFDFLDEQAEQLEIESREVHHTWKNNSLPLRFWSNIVKNPNFVLDINKSNTVDSSLSVVAQLFMDSCSPDVHRLGKDSPANKLLYAKEIPEYKKLVQRFYADVKNSSFDEDSFNFSLEDMSEKYGDTFNSCNAASELMTYAIKYKVKVMDNLEDHGYQDFADKLQEIMENIPDD